MGKFDVMLVSDVAVVEAETEAPLTLFGLLHPRTGKEVRILYEITRDLPGDAMVITFSCIAILVVVEGDFTLTCSVIRIPL